MIKACAGQVWKVVEQEDSKLTFTDDRAVPRKLLSAGG